VVTPHGDKPLVCELTKGRLKVVDDMLRGLGVGFSRKAPEKESTGRDRASHLHGGANRINEMFPRVHRGDELVLLRWQRVVLQIKEGSRNASAGQARLGEG